MKLFNNSRCLVEAVLRMYETSCNLNFFEKFLKNQVTSKEKPPIQSVDILNFDKQRKVIISLNFDSNHFMRLNYHFVTLSLLSLICVVLTVSRF